MVSLRLFFIYPLLIALFLLPVVTTSILLAVEPGRVISVSKSGKTASVNYGQGDGIRSGDVAKFFLRPGHLESKPRYIGEGRAIKVFINHSLWLMDYFAEEIKLTAKDEIVLFKVSDYKYFKGKLATDRRNYVVGQRSQYDLAELMDYELRDQPQENIKDSEDFGAGLSAWKSNVGVDNSKNGILPIRDLSQWKATPQDKELYIKKLKTAPPTAVLVDRRFDNDFDSLLHSYFQMIGDPAVNLANYKKQEKDDASGLINEKTSLTNTFEDYHERQMEVAQERERHVEMTKREGSTWSDRMGDEEIYRYVEKRGMNLEDSRQGEATDRSLNHEFKFIYGRPYDEMQTVVSKSSSSSSDSSSDSLSLSYSWRLGYEFYYVRALESLNYLTSSLWIGQDSSRMGLTLGKGDGEMKTTYVMLDVNYYLMGHPTRLYRPLVYLGTGFAYGGGSMESISHKNKLNNYDMTMFPELTIGVKYRFAQVIGIQVGSSYERFNYSLSDKKLETGFFKTETRDVLKIFVGLSAYI